MRLTEAVQKPILALNPGDLSFSMSLVKRRINQAEVNWEMEPRWEKSILSRSSPAVWTLVVGGEGVDIVVDSMSVMYEIVDLKYAGHVDLAVSKVRVSRMKWSVREENAQNESSFFSCKTGDDTNRKPY